MTLEALCTTSSDVLIHDTFNASTAAFAAPAGTGSFLFGNAPPVEVPAAAAAVQANGENSVQQGRRKRRRRPRSTMNAVEAERQRMTHIAVERNRRRQMKEYLAALRSLMPESYVHRSDQTSVVSGAIDYVKELEQQLQSLEAQKLALNRQLQHRRSDTASERDAAQPPTDRDDPASAGNSGSDATGDAAARSEGSAPEPEPEPQPPPFARFFRYPQYSWRHAPAREDVAAAAVVAGADEAGRAPAVADVEVGMVVGAHARLRVMAPRRPGQLLRMVAGMQALGLAVLHLNVATALDATALYTLCLKVEEGCALTTAEEIAAAVHHVLCIIDAEATAQRLLVAGAGAAGQPGL